MRQSKFHTGYCPFTKSERTITLICAEFNVVGNLGTQLSVRDFVCSNKEECQFHHEHIKGLCPLADIQTP